MYNAAVYMYRDLKRSESETTISALVPQNMKLITEMEANKNLHPIVRSFREKFTV